MRSVEITAKTEYAVRAMLQLAEAGEPDLPISVDALAQAQELPRKFLESILADLRRAELVISTKGARGGYRLARRPEDYTARDILRLTEGSLAPVACLDCEVNTCPRSANCPTLPLWQGLDRVIEDYLAGVTLQDLIDRQREHSGDDYVI